MLYLTWWHFWCSQCAIPHCTSPRWHTQNSHSDVFHTSWSKWVDPSYSQESVWREHPAGKLMHWNAKIQYITRGSFWLINKGSEKSRLLCHRQWADCQSFHCSKCLGGIMAGTLRRRGSVFDLRPPMFQFRILSLEGSPIWFTSPSSRAYRGPVQPVCAQMWPKAPFIRSFLALSHWPHDVIATLNQRHWRSFNVATMSAHWLVSWRTEDVSCCLALCTTITPTSPGDEKTL